MVGKISLYSVLLLALFGLLSLSGYMSYTTNNPAGLLAPFISETVPNLSTETWGVFDPKTGTVYQGENLQLVAPIASLTKLFTAYAVMVGGTHTSPVTINWSDLNTEGESGKLYYGQIISQYQLLFPLLIESSNDAGTALRRSSGKNFSDSLSVIKQELNLASTVITDGSGLSAKNVSTANELVRFYSYLKKEYPHLIDMTRLKMYITADTGFINNNPVAYRDDFRGGKNGFTPAAGKTFIGTFETEAGEEVGVVLLGSTDVLTDIDSVLSVL